MSDIADDKSRLNRRHAQGNRQIHRMLGMDVDQRTLGGKALAGHFESIKSKWQHLDGVASIAIRGEGAMHIGSLARYADIRFRGTPVGSATCKRISPVLRCAYATHTAIAHRSSHLIVLYRSPFADRENRG